MKNIILFTLSLAVTAFVVSCNNKNSGGGDQGAGGVPAGYATTPQPCNLNQPGCVPSNYQNYGGMNYGGAIFPNQWNPGYGNCGCPSAYAPTMFPNAGSLGCLPTSSFQGINPMMYNFNAGYGSAYGYGAAGYGYGSTYGYGAPINSNWQMTNVPPVQFPAQFSACSQQVGQGCDMRINSCPGGTFCQPLNTAGSTVGICRR